MNAMAAGMLPALALLLGVAAACQSRCSAGAVRDACRRLPQGAGHLADGGTIRLPEQTALRGELADTVNRTSEQLRRRNEIIARRDDARTSWIAGASHDVRTPLALILGWAEQLEQDTLRPPRCGRRRAASAPRVRSCARFDRGSEPDQQLQYGAQPLRCRPTQAGPLLRRLAAEFCDSPLAARCTVALEIAPDADKAILTRTPRCWPVQWKTCCKCGLPQPRPRAGAAFRGAHRKNTEDHNSRRRRGLPAPPCCTPCRPVKRGENTPPFWVCTSSSRSSAPTAARRSFARNAPRGAKGGAGAAGDGRSCRKVGVGRCPARGLFRKIAFSAGLRAGVPGPCGECVLLFHKKSS